MTMIPTRLNKAVHRQYANGAAARQSNQCESGRPNDWRNRARSCWAFFMEQPQPRLGLALNLVLGPVVVLVAMRDARLRFCIPL